MVQGVGGALRAEVGGNSPLPPHARHPSILYMTMHSILKVIFILAGTVLDTCTIPTHDLL